MIFSDLIRMARQNLWRTKLRTSLTLIGVIIGIGALISMVSFGIGLEKNTVERFRSNDLFTSLTISTKAFNFKGPRGKAEADKKEATAVPLNDSLIELLQKRPEVGIAYPKINVPVRITIQKDTISSTTGSLPMAMSEQAPYDQLYAGKYFSNDAAMEALVSLDLLKSLGWEVVKKDKILKGYQLSDTSLKLAMVDTILGKEITILSTSLKSTSPLALMAGLENMVGEEATRIKIVGILKEEQFSGPSLREEIILPINTAKNLPSLGFDRISDLIESKSKGNKYTSIYVKTKNMEGLKQLKSYLDEQKINYFAIDDGLTEMKKAFLVLDSILGIIGLISLMVAGFGIVNTMLMSILERKREIGIMKAVGGKNRDIRMIFFFEAGFIGLVGAVGGILLGYGLTRIANLFVNSQYVKDPEEYVDLFSFPMWLIGGSVLFSVLISLLAGLYPAIRASRIRPIEALRQEG